MAQVSSDQGLSNSAVDPALDQSILQQNYQMYVGGGGNPSNYTVGPGGVFSAGSVPNAAAAGGYGAYGLLGGGYGTSYAPYDVGSGKTKWDEFVQQMQLEQQKLQQAQEIENARLAQEKLLQEEQLAQQQKIADQNTVEAFNKNLLDMKGPKDPYGYLFASRGLAAPQGYSPTAMPLPDAVKASYQSQGIDLAAAQQQLVGSSGPSFIQGYLGGMPNTLQQGPMGFQNSSQFANVAPGSQEQQGLIQSQTTPTQQPNTPPPQQQQPPQPPQTQMASGGTVPGYDPGHDTVSAKLSPGEGVLRPETVQMLGGPQAIAALNERAVQHFATGGMVQGPLYQQSLTDMGNGLYQRGQETATARDVIPGNIWDTLPNSGWGGGPTTVPVWTSAGNAAAPVGGVGFNQGGISVSGAATPQGIPVTLSNGMQGFVNPGDIAAFQMPYTGTKESMNPDLPSGYQLQAPGVATQQNAQPSEISQPLGTTPPGSIPGSPSSAPLGTMASPALLTGGVLNSTGPINGPVMNLNNLDPYTRSLVDQYGRPQIPSAQALSNMPSSGLSAYQNYVEKVAGGNFQDLLDQSNQMNPSGFNPGDLSFQ